MSLDFLKSLFGEPEDQNPNENIDNIKDLIKGNQNDVQADWEKNANDSILKGRLADAQPYPLAPMDLKKDQFSALSGILPEQPNDIVAQHPPVPEIEQPPQMPQAPQPPRAPAAPMPPVPAPAMTPPPSAAPQAPIDAPPAPAQPDAYDKMLADKRGQMNMLNMLESADRIGTAIAGQGNLKFETGKYDNLRQQAGQEAEDFIKGQKYKQDQTKFGLDTQKAGLDIEKAKGQMDDDKAKRDPNSELSKVTRASVIDNLNRIGRKDLASQITPGMSNKQVEDIFGQYNLQNMVTNYEAQQNRLEMAKMRVGEKQKTQSDKLDQKDADRLDKFNKAITASIASSRGAFGKMANIKRSAEAIEQLVAQQPPGQMDNRQIQELARSLDAMLSQGAATITGTAHLVPRSMSGDSAKIQEYISSIPRGAGQAAFVKKMVETVRREKELADRQIRKESKALLGSGKDIADRHPEAWGMMLKQHNLPEDIFADDEDQSSSSHPQFNVDKDALAAELKKRGIK